ncbi:MAG: hypothetical protein KatS3mg131_0658 [Candidatus Tectimicrobiota bacterium]|nr:MAG: hypothetical protein KatS3mg131_0658 [Candidatus Tectomicrobia bacterium]
MLWLYPTAFALLALIPLLIILHTLRRRRRDVQVSTLFLWESVAREAHGTLGFHRLVQNLPLLLQILLVLLLTAGLARPVRTYPVAASKDVVLVLDVSASMQARTPQGTRFALAQQQALRLLDQLPHGRQMAVIAAGRQPRVVTFFTEDKALLRQAITALRASDAPGNMREALLLALSFTQGSSRREVVVIGDGAYPHLGDLDLRQHGIRHLRIEGGDTNVGITRLAFRKVLDADTDYEMLVTVQNFSAHPMTVPLRVTLWRYRLLERVLQLAPGQQETLVATVAAERRGVATAEIEVDDDFALDNRAYGVLAAPAQTWVLLVGESNFFLEKLLAATPGVLVNVVPGVTAEALPRLLEANQLLIFNGVPPPPLHQGNFLLINTVPPDARFATVGQVRKPRILDWDSQHPLLQFVDFSEVQVERALAIRPQGEARSLVDAEGTALLSVLETPSLRLAVLGFDLLQSDFPLRVAFPVFMRNVLRWVRPQQEEAAAGQIQAGMPYPVFFDLPVRQVEVQDPQGKRRDYTVSGNPWWFTEAERVGVYIFRAGEQKRYLAVNLLDAAESDINPANKVPPLGPEKASALPHDSMATAPLWPYLLLGAVGILLGEWLVWCRQG